MDSKEEKNRLRKKAKDTERLFSEAYIKDSDGVIRDAVVNDPDFLRAETVFVYVSVGKEPDTAGLMEEALGAGKTVLVPKCYEKPFMKAVEIRSLSELKPGRFDIPEPLSDEAYEGKIDLAIVPCVAASEDGKRLGHGGGFYDCFLSKKDVRKICLCRRKLIFENIPVDENDIVMDKIITD